MSRLLSCLACALLSAALLGCSYEPLPSALAGAAAAAGGADAIRGLRAIGATVIGRRFEPGQGRSPGAPPVDLGEFSYTVQHDVAGDRVHVDWRRPSLPGLPLSYQEIVAGDVGYFNGRDAIASMADRSAMLPARIAAVRKHQRLLWPHLLLRRALEAPQGVPELPGAMYRGVPHRVLAVPDRFQPVHLYIDARTGLVSRVETLEDDPVWGDASVEVAFDDWRRVGGLLVPHAAQISLRGTVVHTETRAAVEVDGALLDGLFAVPEALRAPPDPQQALRGEAISEYLHRFAALGFPQDLDQSLYVKADKLGDGVFHITGAGAHSLAVELPEGIVVVEAPIDDARSRAVIAEVRRTIPGKRITHVVNTHHHDDHAGGLRTYVAEGAEVVTAAANEPHLRAVFAAAHTARPDSLAQRPAVPRLLTVGAAPLELGGNARTVRVLPVQSGHADGLLIVYVSDVKLVFVADIYNPGAFPPNMPLPDPFGVGARELHRALVTDLRLDVQAIVGAHGVGVATLATLAINAGG